MAKRTVSSVNTAAGGRRPAAGAGNRPPASGGFFSQNFGQAPFRKRTAPGAAGGRLNTAVSNG